MVMKKKKASFIYIKNITQSSESGMGNNSNQDK